LSTFSANLKIIGLKENSNNGEIKDREVSTLKDNVYQFDMLLVNGI